MGTVLEMEQAQPQAAVKELKLVKKLAEIMSAVRNVEKKGWNNFHKYHYATEADVSIAVREQLAQRFVMMIPSVLHREIREHINNKGKTEYIAIVDMEFKFIDGESGEEIVFFFSGEGQDAGDKAIYKAETGTQKYAMMKVFQIPTGDDPERDNDPQSGNNQQQQQNGQQQGQNRPQGNGQVNHSGKPQNSSQAPQEPKKPIGPTKGELKAKYKELFGTESDFEEVDLVKKFTGNGSGLMVWLQERITEREKMETQVFEASRAKGAEDIKTTMFVLAQLRKGNTYPGILQALQGSKK